MVVMYGRVQRHVWDPRHFSLTFRQEADRRVQTRQLADRPPTPGLKGWEHHPLAKERGAAPTPG